MSKTLLVSLALLLAACAPVATTPGSQPSVSDVRFGAERNASGVLLTLDNGSRSPVGYNLCTSDLERQTAAGWSRVETGEVCTMQLLTLNPGHDATFQKTLPQGLPSGTYRYTTGVEIPLGTSQVRLATDPFQV